MNRPIETNATRCNLLPTPTYAIACIYEARETQREALGQRLVHGGLANSCLRVRHWGVAHFLLMEEVCRGSFLRGFALTYVSGQGPKKSWALCRNFRALTLLHTIPRCKGSPQDALTKSVSNTRRVSSAKALNREHTVRLCGKRETRRTTLRIDSQATG